jgi:hypothetical protein
VRWEPFDPTRLMALAKAQRPDEPWLAQALSRCTVCLREGRAYLHFVDPDAAVSSRDDLDFDRNIVLVDSEDGDVVLDVLTGHRVGGAEFHRYR